MTNRFHNPYNFIPTPPRNNVTGPLGDAGGISNLPGHDRYRDDHYSGKITIRLTTASPLVMVNGATREVLYQDRQKPDGKKHFIYEILKDINGRPFIPESSIRGAFRAAFEAATNSRLGVFGEHDQKLGYRHNSNERKILVPAKIQGETITLFFGNKNPNNGLKPGDQFAAWMPIKDIPSTLKHGQKVYFKYKKVEKHVWDDTSKDFKKKISSYNKVTKFSLDGENYKPTTFSIKNSHTSYQEKQKIRKEREGTQRRNQKKPPSYHIFTQSNNNPIQTSGFFVETFKNFGNKHDERIFFYLNKTDNSREHIFTEELSKKWKTLIRDYSENYKKSNNPAINPGTKPSRHLTNSKEYFDFKKGIYCFAELDSNNSNNILGLYPVQISRDFYESSPTELLDPSLKPARSFTEMSPADRLFGIVGKDKNTTYAYKSHISFGRGNCTKNVEKSFIKTKDNQCIGLPLTNLAEPKPQQGLFYVAKDKEGTPQSNNMSKKRAGYDNPSVKSLRGRKVYPHHKYLKNYSEYWKNADIQSQNSLSEKGKETSIYREYVRGNQTRDSQNRSITGWIKPDEEFTFDIYLDNISKCDLGALLWLIDPGQPSGQEEFYHRFGGGKPLGFGSAKLTIMDIDLRTGAAIKQDYIALSRNKGEINRDDIINTYKDAVLKAYGNNGDQFDEIPFIKAIKNSMKGMGTPQSPVHYPRKVAHSSNPKNYEWFGSNGPNKALPALYSDDTSLPLKK